MEKIKNYDKIYNYWWDGDQLWGERKSAGKPFKIDIELARKRLLPYKPKKDKKLKTYVRENGNPVAFDEEGNLKDVKTNETGTLVLPEIIVKSSGKPKSKSSYFYNPYQSSYNIAGALTHTIYKNSDTLQDIVGVMRAGDFSSIIDQITNGLFRRFGGKQDTKVKDLKVVKPQQLALPQDTTVIDPTLKLRSVTGDTIPQKTMWGRQVGSGKWMITPQSINITNLKFGSRNRGNYNLIKSPGALLTTYKPFYSYEDILKQQGQYVHKDAEGHINEYMGYDKQGNFKIGPIENFGPEDILTQVYYGWIFNFPRDKQGNYIWGPTSKDSRRFVPKFYGSGENYDKEKGLKSLTLMSPKNKKDPTTYGNVEGGGILVSADGEHRLLRGSIDNVIKEIELFQKNHKNKPVKYYELDNGSYNRGLTTYDQIFTPEDLKSYDNQNRHAGHFMYVLEGQNMVNNK